MQQVLFYVRAMGQNFIPDTVNQTLLFPPSLHDWLPDGHLARFLLDVVAALDLSAIYKSYQDKDGRGQAAYAPEMMVRLLLYGYAKGVYSSRKIQTRTFEDVAFRYLSGDQHPDHATIAEFRNRQLLANLGELDFVARTPQSSAFDGLSLPGVRAFAE